jgi:hypothetical protein
MSSDPTGSQSSLWRRAIRVIMPCNSRVDKCNGCRYGEPMNDTDLRSDAIDAMADAGLLPADEMPGWIADRWDGATIAPSGLVVAARIDTDDERVRLLVATTNGVIYAEASFGLDELGLAMFVGAATAAASR